MFDLALFELLIGPCSTDAAITAMGTEGAEYISERNTIVNTHWTYYQDGQYFDGVLSPHHSTGGIRDNGTEWVNFYDRAQLYYMKYKASGYTDTTSRDRARAVVEYYMTDITAGFTNWLIEPLYSSMTGVGAYYADTGSATAETFIQTELAKWMSGIWLPRIGRTITSPTGYDGRTTSRGLNALLVGYLCNFAQISHPNWGDPDVPITIANACRQALEQTITGKDSDGIWRYQSYGPGLGGSSMAKPWMIGMIMTSVIEYYRILETDSRIPPMIQLACEYLYTGVSATLRAQMGNPTECFWVPSVKQFHYLEGSSDDEPGPIATPTPSLSGLLINAYAFTYHQTGDATWSSRALDILTGLNDVSPPVDSFVGGKLINENYAISYKAFTFLLDASSPPSTRTIRLRGV